MSPDQPQTRELTPVEQFLNKIVFWMVGAVIFVAAFCLPFLTPLMFKLLRLAGAKNEPLIKFAVAGAGAFLLCLILLMGVLLYFMYVA